MCVNEGDRLQAWYVSGVGNDLWGPGKYPGVPTVLRGPSRYNPMSGSCVL